MIHHLEAEIIRIERQARRNRFLSRLLGSLLAGLGVLAISLLIPVWGGIQYAVYMEEEGIPELRFYMGFIIMAAGLVMLGLSWYFYYRAPHLETLREAYAKADIMRKLAKERRETNQAQQDGGGGHGPGAQPNQPNHPK